MCTFITRRIRSEGGLRFRLSFFFADRCKCKYDQAHPGSPHIQKRTLTCSFALNITERIYVRLYANFNTKAVQTFQMVLFTIWVHRFVYFRFSAIFLAQISLSSLVQFNSFLLNPKHCAGQINWMDPDILALKRSL